jgi:Domain of unknown function (DUF6378)
MKQTKQTKQTSAVASTSDLSVKLSLLARAELTINGQRQQDYGDKLPNFTQIAMLVTGTLARKLIPGTTITPDEVALIMMQVKIARLAHMPNHKDSILDIAGYAGCMDKLQEERTNMDGDFDTKYPNLLSTVMVRS